MTITFETDVKRLFRPGDISCMLAYDVKLDDYAWMSDPAPGGAFSDHANARTVFTRLTGAMKPRMPMGGPYWADPQIRIFEQWMADGFAEK